MPENGPAESESQSKHDRAESVKRQLAGTEGGPGGTASPAVESPVREEELTDEVPDSPKGVGESSGQRGEHVAEAEGKEPGRHEGPRQHESDRPTGTSDDRDQTST